MVHVSEILESFPEAELIAWKLRVGKKECERVSQEALGIGTMVDQMIQVELKQGHPASEQVELPPGVVNCLAGWHQFQADHPEILSQVTGFQTELEADDIVGHPDMEFVRPPAWGILDVKCAGSIRPAYWTQVAAYAWLKAGGMYPECKIILGILRLDKVRGGYEYQELTDQLEVQHEIDVWVSCYLKRWRHRIRVAERYRQWKEELALS